MWSMEQKKEKVFCPPHGFVVHRGPDSILGTNEAKDGEINDAPISNSSALLA